LILILGVPSFGVEHPADHVIHALDEIVDIILRNDHSGLYYHSGQLIIGGLGMPHLFKL
jgi:hypothetical protein